MKNIFRMLKYVKNYKKEVILNILFNILYIFFNLFSIAMVVPFVSILFGLIDAPQQCPELSISKDVIINYVAYWLNYYKVSQGFFKCLLYIVVGFIGFTLLGNICRYMSFFFLAPIRNGVIKDLRVDVYKKLTNLPISFFAKYRRGDIISRFTSDIAVIEWSVFTCLQMIIKNPIAIIVYLTALILASWKFTLFVIIILPLPLILIKKIGESLNRNSLKGQQKTGRLISFAQEAISLTKNTKASNAEQIMYDQFLQYNNDYTKTINKVLARRELASPLTEFFAILVLSIIVIVGGTFVLNSQMAPTILIAYVVIFSRLISPVQELIRAYYNLKNGEASAQRIYQILDSKEKIEEKDNALSTCLFDKEIKFENVGFSYENNDGFQLENINFKIKKGQKVAIVGASGAGKSTLFDLFVRFADTNQGQITIDGINIKDFSINALRNCFGIVTQESILFNDSVKNNIAFGLEYVEEDDIIKAAKIANADEFIIKLPYGYNTNIGDNGCQLSGGQRQRLCIARAVLRNPQILLMDEPTSAMDTENEKKVSIAISNVLQNRTLIIIAHRLSTIIDSDIIIVMDRGKIVESGTHQELLQLNGYYSKLIKLQSL